jgi:hypothetical protein
MEAETDALRRSAGNLRGIAPRGKLQRRLYTQLEAQGGAEALLRSQYAADQLATQGKLLERLGLLSPGTDVLELLVQATAREATSYYDAGTRTLLVADWIALPAQRARLAHELAHALQDQRFGLGRLQGEGSLDWDRRLARQALIEGEAGVLTMEIVEPQAPYPSARELGNLVEKLRATGGPAMKQLPGVLRETMAFPHVEGFAFVLRIRAREPWAAVDALWRRPPESTEQILHPEKYDRNELPLRVEATPLPRVAADHTAAALDSLGELLVRLWLARFVSPDVAERAAAGWGGDRVALYLPTDKSPGGVVAWLTVWDSVPDAEDFHAAASAAAADLAPFVVERRETRVALLIGAPERALPDLDTMLKGWKVTAGEKKPGTPRSRPARPGSPRRGPRAESR